MNEKVLKQVTVDPAIIENERIMGFLDGMSYADDAKGIALKNAGFWNGKEYVSGADNPNNITNESIRQVSLDLGNGNKRYFKQIGYEDGSTSEHSNAHGMKVTAWEEIDAKGNAVKDANGKQEIRIAYTGFLPKTASPLKLLSDPDTKSLEDVMGGRLNPQAQDAAAFTDNIIKQVGKENISDIIYGSHSFGAGQVVASHAVSDLEGVKTKMAMLMEPGVSNQQKELVEKAMADSGSDFSKKLQALTGSSADQVKAAGALLEQHIKGDTVSIQQGLEGKDGNLHGSLVAHTMPGANLGLPGSAGNVAAFGIGLTALVLETGTQKLSGNFLEGDRVLTGSPHEGSAPIGKAYIEKVVNDPTYHTTSAMGGVDPAHQLEPMVDQAAKTTFYQV